MLMWSLHVALIFDSLQFLAYEFHFRIKYLYISFVFQHIVQVNVLWFDFACICFVYNFVFEQII